MEQESAERLIASNGVIEYTLTRKRVKNINLRIDLAGQVKVSAPRRVPKKEIEAFLLEREAWIEKNRRRMQQSAAAQQQNPCPYTAEQCLGIFAAVSDTIFPLFSDVLGGEKPTLIAKEMKSRWGICRPKQKTITLNTRLAQKPRAALEYVVMHEYVHFLHADHQEGFHKCMAYFMPDYKERRKLLK